MNTTNEYRNNFLIEPLFLFNDQFCAVFTDAVPDGFCAASWDLAKRVGTLAVALFAYIGLSFVALIGLMCDSLIRESTITTPPQIKPEPNQPTPDHGENPLTRNDVVPIHITVDELKKTSRMFKSHDLWMLNFDLQLTIQDKYCNNENVITLSCQEENNKHIWSPNVKSVNPYLHFIEIKPNARYILMPVLSGKHFSGIVIDRGEDRKSLKFIIYNGLGNSPRRIEDFLVETISKQAGIPAERVQNKTLHQKDAWSCGYRVLKFFDDIVSGKTLEEIDKEELKIEEFHSYVNDQIEFMIQHPEP